MGVMPFFGQKLLNTCTVWTGGIVTPHVVHVNHHYEMGKRTERVSKKISLRPNTTSLNNALWYTDADGLLEHSPSRGSLYCKGLPLRR